MFHAHGKETFQPGRAAVSCFNPKQSFVTSFVSAPKTNVSESTVFSQTNKLVEKRFVFEGLKLAPTEFVLSFQFQSNFSEKGLLRAPKLTFPHGKGWFWEENICFLFRSFQAKAWAAKKRYFRLVKQTFLSSINVCFNQENYPFSCQKLCFLPKTNSWLHPYWKKGMRMGGRGSDMFQIAQIEVLEGKVRDHATWGATWNTRTHAGKQINE